MSPIQGVSASPVTATPKVQPVRSEAKETQKAERVEKTPETGEQQAAPSGNPSLGSLFSAIA